MTNYWEKYYKDHVKMQPSNFVLFAAQYIPFPSRIIDIGSGDGRDLSILKKHGNVISVEPNTERPGLVDGTAHFKGTLEDFLISDTASHFKPTVVYARWFLHAVPEDTENQLLDFVQEYRCKLLAEFRVIGDKVDDSHYRRLIDHKIVMKKLEDRGFIIRYVKVSKGFSQQEHDDPYLCRIVAEHKNS